MNDESQINASHKIWLRTVCQKNGLSLSDEQLEQLARYAELLLKWNRDINLVSRKDEPNIWQSHILHSLTLLIRMDVPLGQRVLDLGTGGGLPGIPMKIVRPDLTFLLLDSTKKKIDAVSDMVAQLGLTGIETRWGRAEDVGKEPAHSGAYDLVVARAVASLNDLIKWGKPFLNPSNPTRRLVTLKGGDMFKEILHARRVSGAKDVHTIPLSLADVTEFLASDKKIVVVEF